jgi:hypothetical protein
MKSRWSERIVGRGLPQPISTSSCRTLARSQTDQVSLVDLLSDVETRDSILDHPRLVDAILNHCGHLRISSQFYFYVLARHVLQQGGIGDRKLCDYVASLLETFSHASRLQISDETHHLAEQYISDILIALNRATPEQAFLLRAHIGNYSLFISGIFHENTQRRSLRGGPDIKFYEQVAGRTINLYPRMWWRAAANWMTCSKDWRIDFGRSGSR